MTGCTALVGGPDTPPTAYERFFGSPPGDVSDTRYAVERALLAFGISDAANVTLGLLHGAAARQLAYMNDAGEVPLPVLPPVLAEQRRVGIRALRYQFAELEKCGALRREVRSESLVVWIAPLPRLWSRLMNAPGVSEQHAMMFPDAPPPPFLRHALDANDDDERAIVADINFQKQNNLFTLLAKSKQDTNARAQQNDLKKAARAAAKQKEEAPNGTTIRIPVPKEDSPQWTLVEYLRSAVKRDIETAVLPKNTGKERGQMATLLKDYTPEQLRTVIDYCTKNWPAICHQLRLGQCVPSVSILLGYVTSIFPLALDAEKKVGKRTGGAEWVDTSKWVQRDDPDDF